MSSTLQQTIKIIENICFQIFWIHGSSDHRSGKLMSLRVHSGEHRGLTGQPVDAWLATTSSRVGHWDHELSRGPKTRHLSGLHEQMQEAVSLPVCASAVRRTAGLPGCRGRRHQPPEGRMASPVLGEVVRLPARCMKTPFLRRPPGDGPRRVAWLKPSRKAEEGARSFGRQEGLSPNGRRTKLTTRCSCSEHSVSGYEGQ